MCMCLSTGIDEMGQKRSVSDEIGCFYREKTFLGSVKYASLPKTAA